MDTSLISVIIPVYNKEAYVAQMLTSVKGQEFRNYECLLVDDGAADASGLVCEQMVTEEPNFVVIHTRNGGVSHARNVALELACGEYITFIDSDDEVPLDYLQRIASDIAASQADMVVGGIQSISELRNEKKVFTYPYENRIYAMRDLFPTFAEAQASCGVFGWCVNKTFRRELAGDCRFDESLTLYEDFDFYLRVYPRINTVHLDDTILYNYLSERSNFSSFKDSEIDYLAQVEVNVRYKQFLESQDSWSGCNERIVSEAIQRFLFLSVFHAPLESFDERFGKAVLLLGKARISISGKKGFTHLLLSFIKGGHLRTAKATIRGYRVVRKIVKRHVPSGVE